MLMQGKSAWGTFSKEHSTGDADAPLYLFAETVLTDTHQRFRQGFPGEVTYAVKANPDPAILETLARSGMAAFDVASVAEMKLVRGIHPGARLHYHNPVRSRAEISAARSFDITSWSVDRLSELDKLGVIEGDEISVRLKLPVTGAAYDFGSKFGATPDEAVDLLKAVVARGGRPSMTFHPGTQCQDPNAWARYIGACAEVAERAGVKLHRLNVGGGFAARRGTVTPDLEAVFRVIGQATHAAFGAQAPALVCEPGRAMVAEAVTLVLRVKAISGDAVFLNDGLYGALAEWRDMGAPDRVEVLTCDGAARSGEIRDRIVFGPTCDSLDRLTAPLPLPGDIEEGDLLVIAGMGAYARSLATQFNGYGHGPMLSPEVAAQG